MLVAMEQRAFLIGGGETGALIRDHDWTTSPLGTPAAWPRSLCSALELMLDSPESMYLVWGPELIFFYNDAYRPILGPRFPGALGQPLAVLWADAWEAVRVPLEQALQGQAVRFVDMPIEMARRGEPEQTWWNYSFSPLRDDAGQIAGVLCFTRETTEHVKASQALRDSEQRLDALIRSSSEVRFHISADWSQLHELNGGNFIPDTQTTNSSWLDDYIPAHARDMVRAEIARAIATGTYHIEHPVNRVDGTIGWAHVRAVPLFDADGTVTSWLGAASDISARKEAEAALKAREAQLRELNATLEQQVVERTAKLRLFRDVIEANAVPICIFDTECRQIAFNQAHARAMQELYGVAVQGGEVLPELVTAEQRQDLHANMQRALRGETFRVAAEYGQTNGERRSYELAYTPLHDADGQVIGAFHFAQDITEQIRSQLELERTQSALRQAQKLEAVGQLTGGVAHDFNNLLTVIKSSSDLLKRPGLPDEKRLRYIEAISDTVDRASRLTGQLLSFARRQTLRPEVFAVGESLHALTDMLETLNGTRIELALQMPSQPCHVYADASQFDTAIVNMALNARDSLNGVGRIQIRVKPCTQIPAGRMGAAINGDFVAVSITDTGTGIEPEHLEAIFEPFFTTKELGKGTGLGLSQVFGFAKQSGGEVMVDSVVGEGTTFTLYLPRVAARPSPRAKLAEPQPLDGAHGTRVLVVEDNPDVGSFCVSALLELGYQPTLTCSAEQALACLGDATQRFEVVFSDVVMPGMNGIDLATVIHRKHPLLPVVLTSGYSEVLAQQGSHGFELLHKPYSVEQLSRILAGAIQRAVARD